ncbi:hypothetical protein TVAG_114500 [Trichomonas vaginalis G3]|uniref:Uncharacterized protein n=1 Tax=Trichomonas vaginalis (strain ATCC PRA-98 / G3) TaxID=412133 RepID=A2FAR9_TRIV3|nr:RNase III domain-like family [Trichomonas vaginalis G3]EAX97998.1 hypothetical protein TVAG_114500 [Trichomonas vaginalis G3]KAI5521895.1 RNase III domain-like family [Trichomonas vaginalis G3]|eukprot:XP_001310928.1 hypothetical protein [Trichomonas vaginalis G3]
MNNMDKETWGRFDIKFIKNDKISFLQSRKLDTISNQICNDMGINLPKNFYLIPTLSTEFDIETAKNETNFMILFTTILKKSNIDPLLIYKYPENPNTHSREVYQQSVDLHRLVEIEHNFTPETEREIETLLQQYLDVSGIKFTQNSIFPKISLNKDELFSPAFSMIKFISYFRSYLNALSKIIPLLSTFEIDQNNFPHLVECFSLEFIPSFVKNHNTSERIGDAILEVVITNSIISSLVGKKNYFVNKQIRIAVSNKLFGVIGEHFNFPSCFIGPFDVEKLPGDCFESIAGKLYKLYGYDKVVTFWQKSLFAIPIDVAQKMDIVKAIEVMKISMQSSSMDLTPDPNLDIKIKNLIGNNLVPPPVIKDEMLTKCKLIGAALIKLGIVEQVIARIHETEECILIQSIGSKSSIDSVAKKLGLKDSKHLRIICGGIMLQNDFEKTREFIEVKIIPHFNIVSEMRSGRIHSQDIVRK